MKLARDQKSAERFAHLASELEDAHEKDVLSRALLDALVAGDRKQATDAYLDFHKKWIQSHVAATHHYVICLDESGSMRGRKFEAAKRAVEDFATQAALKNQGTASAVSLVMFSHVARVVCNQTPLDKHASCTNNITYKGGGTNFTRPLDHAMQLVQGNKAKYDKQFIMIHSDGQAEFPQAQADLMKRFRDSRENLEFFAIAETRSEALDLICKALYPLSPLSDHCLSQVRPEETSGAMQETLRRMNVAFVQA